MGLGWVGLGTPICNVGTALMWWWNCQMQIKKKPIECDKSTVKCDIGTTQCDDKTIKYEKKKNRVPQNVTKVGLEVMLVLPSVIMKLLNVRKKNKVPLNVTKV